MVNSPPSRRADCVLTLAVALSSRARTRGPARSTLRLLERWPVPAVVEKHEVPIGNVVQDRDADFEGHHPVVPPVDQEDGCLDAGEVLGVVVRQAHRLPARLGEFGRPSVRPVDLVHQLVGHQGLVIDAPSARRTVPGCTCPISAIPARQHRPLRQLENLPDRLCAANRASPRLWHREARRRRRSLV